MAELNNAEKYASQMATQMRKGFIAYCVLKVCSNKPVYTSDIIKDLQAAELVVVEGTINPLLSRLQREGLLSHQWQESEQGPPRKYYTITDFGREVMEIVGENIANLNKTIKKL